MPRTRTVEASVEVHSAPDGTYSVLVVRYAANVHNQDVLRTIKSGIPTLEEAFAYDDDYRAKHPSMSGVFPYRLSR